MVKRRQIPRLFAQPSSSGKVFHYWKPEKRLRQLGYKNLPLGSDPAEAARAAIELNAGVTEAAPPTGERGPVVPTFAQLVKAYKASGEYLSRKPKTRKGYDTWLTQLEDWAMAGELRLDALSKGMIRDLKAELLDYDKDGNVQGSLAKCAAMLTTLRLLLRWAVANEKLDRNPMEGITIPQPKARTQRIDWPAVEQVAALAAAKEIAHADIALPLAFWTLQRATDQRLRFRRDNYVEIEAINPEDREWLAGEDGRVMGWELVGEGKTGMVQKVPLVPFLRPAVEAILAERTYLFAQATNGNKPATERRYAEKIRAALDAAGHQGIHLHDMKRSGATWMLELGADEGDILCLSGNSIGGDRKIAGVYMPKTTIRACRALADALRGMAEREKRKAA